MAFLPYASLSAMVEIQPRPNHNSHLWTNIYPAWCKTAGVAHFPVVAELDASSAECRPNGKRKAGGGPLRCNVTVPVDALLEVVRRAVAHVDGAGRNASDV